MPPATGYYLRPPVWIGAPPIGADGNTNLARMRDEVYRISLPNNITARVLREGLFVFDFSTWVSGQAQQTADPGVAIDRWSAAKLQRASVLNAHLACLYTAMSAATTGSYSPEKVVLSPHDLIAFETFEGPPTGIPMEVAGLLFAADVVTNLGIAPGTYAGAHLALLDPRLAFVNTGSYAIALTEVETSFALLATILATPIARYTRHCGPIHP